MKPEPTRAWQPLTLGGAARYAHDGVGRLFLTGLIISIGCVAAILVTVRNAWQPVIDEAISKLPAGAEVRAGKLTAPQVASVGGNKYLSLALDPTGEANPSSTADIHITFSKTELRFRSLFGIASVPYQPHWRIPLNRAEVEPWWGAWRPAVYGYIALATVIFVFATWIGLALVYMFVPLLLVFFALKRDLWLGGAWKLAVASLMPGALFFSFAILLYGLGHLRMEGLLVAWALHFVVGWVFLVGAVFQLPRNFDNPFTKEPVENPFAGEGSPFEKFETDNSSSGGSESEN